jgi:hypothetical protein
MNLILRHTIKSIAPISVVGLLQTKESWKSIIRKEQDFVEKNAFVVVALN